MILSPAWRGTRFAVLGLARSGRATVEALLASGAMVTAWDAAEAPRQALAGRDGLTLADPLSVDLRGFAGVVVSPGVPLNRHPMAAHAAAAGVSVIGDIELFAQARSDLPPHRVVGVTGTNGKSTTTALIHHVLEQAGVPVRLGGNIGLPILGQAPLPEGGVYVLELSSFQIDLTHSLACDVAVLTNVTPDHLDRYTDFADYAAAKERLFTLQGSDGVAVVACDDDPSRMIAGRVAHRLVRVHAEDALDTSRWPALQGPHNAQNAACAIDACRALGVGEDAIEAGLCSFVGLPHRMERVAERGGVMFVNDSKATNAESAAPALAAYPRVHWIAGGQAKSADITPCLAHASHIVAAYLIGEAAPLFAPALRAAGVPVIKAGTLDKAVEAAAAAARPGEAILLSPACASFDQFRDFEDRGDSFRAAVLALGAEGSR